MSSALKRQEHIDKLAQQNRTHLDRQQRRVEQFRAAFGPAAGIYLARGLSYDQAVSEHARRQRDRRG